MVDSKRKEEVSKSYLNALCATKGIAMEIKTHDDDGLDIVLQKVIISKTNSARFNAMISVQLKSTSSDYTEHDDHYTYPLKKKNYDDLRVPATVKPYLFLLILPDDERDWVTHSIEQLVIKKCMFWLDLKGLPKSDNATKVTVHIPKTNIVTSEKLDEILRNIAEEVLL